MAPEGNISDIVNGLIASSTDKIFAVGPSRRMRDGRGQRRSRFTVCLFGNCETCGQGLCIAQIDGVNEKVRRALLRELTSKTSSEAVHTFECEGCLTNFCATTWPCEATAQFMQQMKDHGGATVH